MSDKNNFFKKLMLRFYFFTTLLTFFSFLLIGKLIYIQFYQNNEGLDIQPDTLVKHVILEPSRGDIFLLMEISWLLQFQVMIYIGIQ